jgi:hypothetical protein
MPRQARIAVVVGFLGISFKEAIIGLLLYSKLKGVVIKRESLASTLLSLAIEEQTKRILCLTIK